MDNNTIVRLEHITKVFPGVKALDNVSLQIRKGEVLALLGENGAGKSTMIKVLSGIYTPEEGEIFFEGKEVAFRSPAEAKELGIAIVTQELAFSPLLSVAENLYTRHYSDKNRHFINWKEIYSNAYKALETIHLNLDPRKPMGDCTVAECQQVEIARAIYEDAKVLILDEPTSALNNTEIEELMRCINDLRNRGISVVLITHKIEEIMQIADRVVVLRDGRSVAELNVAETNKDQLIEKMVGREIGDMYPAKTNTPGETLITVRNLRTGFLKNVNFDIRKGEVLGVYGLMGSGHLELGQTLFGCTKQWKGEVTMEGESLLLKSPSACIRRGIAFLPSDRKQEGLVLIHSVKSNIMNPYYQTGTNSWFVRKKNEDNIAKKWIDALSIKTPSRETLADTLSGGNQQKVVLAKWLEINPKVVILNDPTRGIDVGAKAEIYYLLNKLTEQGVSVVMITSEMPELMAMSDRVLVLHEGKQTALLDNENVTQANIVTAAIGGTVEV